jgi:two-component system, OmpR family, sensor histidine kinase MtrB
MSGPGYGSGSARRHGPMTPAHNGPGPVARTATPAGGRQERPVPDFLRNEMLPVLRAAWRWGRRPFLPAARLWRRNIQLRVVATTLLMSLGVVLLLGVVVIGQVRNGLLEAKTNAAQGQALGGFSVAQSQAANDEDPHGTGDPTGSPGATGVPGTVAGRGQVDPGTWLTNLVQQLASGGQGVFYVVALSSGADQQPYQADNSGTHGPRASGDVLPENSVPGELRSEVSRHSGVYQSDTSIIREGDSGGQPGLVIGKRLNDGSGKAYELYYLFPFTQEEKTLSLVETTLATAGVFVVALLGAIAWLVVRQVVTPVRMAAGISQRLADGVLRERMKVSGEDDIARLGDSFNKMAHTLQSKIQQLEELSRMQRRFVSDVSHELRTPLTTVRMAADVIHDSREDFDPVTARSAELLQSQLERFESLLADLLEISRFDAGAAALDAEPIDLRDVVRRVVEAAEPLAERKGSQVLVRGDAHPVVAEADARRVERVLRNLVVNAVEHGEGRDVIVFLASGAGAVAVAVRDYGVGLKPGEATRVFNRFWRADPARARTTGGTGLGLSIAVEDARLHGGRLQAWGEPGGGSQFRLTLPRIIGDTVNGSPIPLEPEDSRRRRGAAGHQAPDDGATAARPGTPSSVAGTPSGTATGTAAGRAAAPGADGSAGAAPAEDRSAGGSSSDGSATGGSATGTAPTAHVPAARSPIPPVPKQVPRASATDPAAVPACGTAGARVVAARHFEAPGPGEPAGGTTAESSAGTTAESTASTTTTGPGTQAGPGPVMAQSPTAADGLDAHRPRPER